jgi:hypothetical protein
MPNAARGAAAANEAMFTTLLCGSAIEIVVGLTFSASAGAASGRTP